MSGVQSGFVLSELTDPERLFGHNGSDGLLSTLCQLLRLGTNLQLIGERRSGKSSVLQCTATLCSVPGSRLIPVYVDYRARQEIRGFNAAYNFLLAHIHTNIIRARIDGWPDNVDLGRVKLGSSIWVGDHYEALGKLGNIGAPDLLERYIGVLGDMRLGVMLLLDEYEHFVRHTLEGQEAGFFPLRKLSSIFNSRSGAPKPLTFAIAGAIPWIRMCALLASPHLNSISADLYLGPIDRTGFRKMWEHCLTESAPIIRERILAQGTTADQAYELAGGWPFYGKLIGIQTGVAGQVHPSAFQMARPHFQITFSRQGAAERKTLIAAAHGELTRTSAQARELVRLGLLVEDEDEIIKPRGLLWGQYLLEQAQDTSTTPSDSSSFHEEAAGIQGQVIAQTVMTIEDLVTELNATGINLNQDAIFHLTYRDITDFRTLRKPAQDRDSFGAFTTALYGLFFERTKKNGRALHRLPETFRRANRFVQFVDILRHSYGNAHIVDSPEWKPSAAGPTRGDVLQHYLESRVEPGPKQFSSLQQGLLRDASEYLSELRRHLSLHENIAFDTQDEGEPSSLQNEHDLEHYLSLWAERGWTDPDPRAKALTGRAGSVSVIKAITWKNARHILKISPDARSLINEANHASVMSLFSSGQLPIVPIVAKATVKTASGEWAGYVVPHVGSASLRDYFFGAKGGNPAAVVSALCDRLVSIYMSTRTEQVEPSLEAIYLRPMSEAIEKLRGYSSFKPLRTRFDTKLTINDQEVMGPSAILAKANAPGALDRLRARAACLVHGDLHFENIRVSPTGTEFWLLDPQGFLSGDYIYDVANMLTSLTGHAHVDRGVSDSEISYPDRDDVKNGEICFNLWHTPHQRTVFAAAIEVLEKHLYRLARDMEKGPSEDQKKEVARQRLSLALARQYLVATRYFRRDSDQLVMFARGAQFLDLFHRSYFLGERIDCCKVLREDRWLNSP